MGDGLIVGDGGNNRDFIDTLDIYRYRKNARGLTEPGIAFRVEFYLFGRVEIVDVKGLRPFPHPAGFDGSDDTRHHPVFLHCVQKRTLPLSYPPGDGGLWFHPASGCLASFDMAILCYGENIANEKPIISQTNLSTGRPTRSCTDAPVILTGAIAPVSISPATITRPSISGASR